MSNNNIAENIDEVKKEKKIKDYTSKNEWRREYCPWESETYKEYLEILKRLNPTFFFYNAEPNGFPNKPKDIIFSFIGMADVEIFRTRPNQTMVRDKFAVPFVANLIVEPNCIEVHKYPNPTPDDHLKLWKSKNLKEQNDYYLLTKYCQNYNIMLYENDDITILAESIRKTPETYLKKR